LIVGLTKAGFGPDNWMTRPSAVGVRLATDVEYQLTASATTVKSKDGTAGALD
jgi:hypothetical protein